MRPMVISTSTATSTATHMGTAPTWRSSTAPPRRARCRRSSSPSSSRGAIELFDKGEDAVLLTADIVGGRVTFLDWPEV